MNSIKEKKTYNRKKKVELKDIMWIIRNNGELGVSELVFGDLQVKFSSNTNSKTIQPNESQTPPQETITSETLKSPKPSNDFGFHVATYGIDNPSDFMERLERGEMEFAETDDNPTGEEL